MTAIRDHLTGSCREEDTRPASEVAIPGAKQKQISAVAAVAEAASVSATENRGSGLVSSTKASFSALTRPRAQPLACGSHSTTSMSDGSFRSSTGYE
jgi:hypothetical protein